MKNEPHPHAAVVEALGRDVIQDQFGITRQAIDYWCKNGIPKQYHKTIAMLGVMRGSAVADFFPDVVLTA